jgi:hypothetical protein
MLEGTRASRVGREPGSVRAWGLGRSTGLRARAAFTASGCPVRGRAPSKPGRRGRAPGSMVHRSRAAPRTAAAGEAQTEARSPVPSSDDGYPEVGAVSQAPPVVTRFMRHDAGGRRSKREPGGARPSQRSETTLAEAGTRRKPLPLASPWPRERHGRPARSEHDSTMHERAPRGVRPRAARRGSRREGPRSVLLARTDSLDSRRSAKALAA